jgi:hypothetical protein
MKKELRKLKKRLTKKVDFQEPSLNPDPPQITEGCQCLDKYGVPKTLYATQKEAQATAEQSSEHLRYYPCPDEKGWHLTKV